MVVVGSSLLWFRGDQREAADEVPLLVADGVRDDFTRSRSPVGLERARTGQPWDQVSGRWEVQEGEAKAVEANALGARTLAVTDLGVADGALAVTLAIAVDGVGVVFRYQDAFNYWLVTAVPSFASWRIDRLDEGVLVEVATLPLVEAEDGTTVEVRFEGRSITVFVDGEQRHELVDGALEHATGIGLVFTGANPERASWDDLVAVPITGDASASVTPS